MAGNLTRACRAQGDSAGVRDHRGAYREKTTDASGILVFDVPPGRYTCSASAISPNHNAESGRAVKLKLVVLSVALDTLTDTSDAAPNACAC